MNGSHRYSRKLSRHGQQRSTAFVVAIVLINVLILFAQQPAYAQGESPAEAEQLAAISPYLETQLATANEPVSFLVILDEQVDAQMVAAEIISSSDSEGAVRTQRAEALYRALTERAQLAQEPLRAWLDVRGVPYRAFYIVNMIEVRGDASLAQALRSAPGVDRLAANPQVRGQEPVVDAPSNSWYTYLPVQGPLSEDTWDPGLYGLPYTHAPEVWDLGYTGQGIVIASQDTGVQWDHPALIERYRGWDTSTSLAAHPYNWYDAWDTPDPADQCGPDYQIPCDDNGHGTHTVGTMVGDATGDPDFDLTILGMAPDAQWIGCRNMRNNFGTPASYATCFEFMLAPYPQGGDPFTDGRPGLAPHVINNSWTCPPVEGCDLDSLRQVVETARAAGQLVVASAGNSGPLCSTIIVPSAFMMPPLRSAPTTQNGLIASFSGRGPVTVDGSNRLKPDIAAPGVSVLSAIPHDNYGHKSGTSMSAPHVAGAAALLWSAAPDFIGNVDLTEQVLIKSATPVADNRCLPGAPASPNPVFGYGRLDVLAAVVLARTPWRVIVTVVDEAGAAQVGVPVVLVDDLTRYRYGKTTNANGIARLKPVLSGTYTLRVGRGDATVRVPSILSEPAGDPNIGERRHRIRITYPAPEPNRLFLPLIGQ